MNISNLALSIIGFLSNSSPSVLMMTVVLASLTVVGMALCIVWRCLGQRSGE